MVKVKQISKSQVRRLMVSHCLCDPSMPLLGILALAPFRYFPLNLPQDIRDAFDGANGLASDHHYIYAALIARENSGLLVLNRQTLQVQGCHPLEGASHVHSIVLRGNHLFVVSTGSNEVIRYTLKNGRPTKRVVVWQPEDSPERLDRHHLNSILVFSQGGFLISGLDDRGRAPREFDWPSRVEGFIRSVPTGTTIRPLWHPHSLLDVDGSLAFCESGAGTLQIISHGLLRGLPGFSRGLCRIGSDLFVATSAARHATPDNPRIADARCTVSRVRIDNLEVLDRIDITEKVREIYDLLPIAAG